MGAEAGPWARESPWVGKEADAGRSLATGPEMERL